MYLKRHPIWLLKYGKTENNMYLKESYQFIVILKVHSLINKGIMNVLFKASGSLLFENKNDTQDDRQKLKWTRNRKRNSIKEQKMF